MTANADEIAEVFPDEEILQLDGFDDCIVGYVERCGMQPIICYDEARIIQKLLDDGFEYEEAIEHFSFNIAGGYMGEGTPCFLTRIGDIDD